MSSSEKAPPENAKDNPNRSLNHAGPKSSPASGQMAASATGGALQEGFHQPPQPTSQGSRQDNQGLADQFVDQAKETVAQAAAATTDTARQAYEQGRRYIDAARERYPEAERYYRESTHGVRQYAADNPLITLLVGVGIGYALAWVFLSGNSDEGARVPDYAKTKRGYSPHWPQPRA